jgi:lysozyme
MNIELLMAELERDEGRRLKPYFDSVGKLTIGCGRNLDDVGISDREADFLLINDIEGVLADLDRQLPWWRSMDEERQRVLANMCFNMGIVKLLTFENTLRYMQARDYQQTAQHMLDSLWARQVGPRALRLAERMKTGSVQT